MTVQIVKRKPKTMSKEDIASLVSVEVVDTFAKRKLKYDAKVKKMAPLKKEVDTLEKEILGIVDGVVHGSASITLQGTQNEVVLGPKGKKSKVTDIELVADMLNAVEEGLFMKLAAVSAADLNAYLTPEQVAMVTRITYANKRRVKVES